MRKIGRALELLGLVLLLWLIAMASDHRWPAATTGPEARCWLRLHGGRLPR